MTIRQRRTRLLAATLLTLSAGCKETTELPEIVVEAVTPSEVEVGTEIGVAISGSGFRVAVSGELGGGVTEPEPITALLGGAELDLVLESESRMRATVPASLSVGVYDLAVNASDGRTAMLADAFEVYKPCAAGGPPCDDGDPCTTSERCTGGRCTNEGNDLDADEDGFVASSCGGGDCDDGDPGKNPDVVWYPDQDGDGAGDAAAQGLSCAPAAASDVANADDCDDTTDTVGPGTSCSDGDDCTQDDVCIQGLCSGLDLCSCADSCDSCSPGGCCEDTCPGGNCTTCSGCSCDYACSDASCSATCNQDTTCRLTATGADANLACASGSLCTVDCTGASGSCSLSCASDALCLLYCADEASCSLGCAGAATVDCGGGVYACHRDCP